MYKELLEYVVKNLVTNPDKVVVSEEEKDSKIILHLTVDSADMGRIIGRSGRNAQAIKTLVQASSSLKENKYVKINIDKF